MNEQLEDVVSKKTHDSSKRGFKKIYALLTIIDNTASDILRTADWSKSVEIRHHVRSAKEELDQTMMDIIACIQERKRVTKQ